MSRELIGFLMITLVLAVALLIWRSVRKKRSAQEALIPELSAPLAEGTLETFYVATVFAAKPLERVWARGLGMRGKGSVSIAKEGVSIHRQGERGFLIPAQAMLNSTTVQATIDKGVEKAGLNAINWTHAGTELQTVLRFTNPEVRKSFEIQLMNMIGAKLG